MSDERAPDVWLCSNIIITYSVERKLVLPKMVEQHDAPDLSLRTGLCLHIGVSNHILGLRL